MILYYLTVLYTISRQSLQQNILRDWHMLTGRLQGRLQLWCRFQVRQQITNLRLSQWVYLSLYIFSL